MIYIKNKGKRTQIFLPRQREVIEDYASKDYVDYQIEEITDTLTAIDNKLEEVLKNINNQ
mgnify:CR=1 FL=1